MQTALQVFKANDNQGFRTLMRDGEPWFVLLDVCRVLEISNPRDAATRLDDDEKDQAEFDTPGGRQILRIVNESGLWSLVLRSNKTEAKTFRKWITGTVIPSLRKTGSFSLGQTKVPAFYARAAVNHDRVPVGWFSVISELIVMVPGKMELTGYMLASKAPDGKEIRLDISVGRLFSSWLKEEFPSLSDNYAKYLHTTPQITIEARMYPDDMLPLFRRYVRTVWIPDHAPDYFRTRDPSALPHLPRLLDNFKARPIGR